MPLTRKQLEERKSGIGGSDAAVALGLSPWRTPVELYEEKLEPVVERESVEGPMLWGSLIEPVIRQRYSDTTGRGVWVPDTLRHPTLPWMLAHPDGLTRDGRMLEIKIARTSDGWGEPGSDVIPEYYLLQVQHNVLVVEAVLNLRIEVSDVPVLIGGSDYRVYEVPTDRELQEMIVEGEREFWTFVESRTPPPLDLNGPRALEVVRKLYRGTDGTTLTADEQLEAWYAVMMEAYNKASDYKAMADGAKAHILGAMKNAALLKFADGKGLRRQAMKRKAYSVPEAEWMDGRIINVKE